MTANVSEQSPCKVTHLIAEARAVLRMLDSIARLLETLVAISNAQTAVLRDGEWAKVVSRKQVLLDEIEVQQPGVLVRQARKLVAQLVEAQQWEMAEQLEEAMRLIRERFINLAANEHAIQQLLQQQVDMLHYPYLRKPHSTRKKARYDITYDKAEIVGSIR